MSDEGVINFKKRSKRQKATAVQLDILSTSVDQSELALPSTDKLSTKPKTLAALWSNTDGPKEDSPIPLVLLSAPPPPSNPHIDDTHDLDTSFNQEIDHAYEESAPSSFNANMIQSQVIIRPRNPAPDIPDGAILSLDELSLHGIDPDMDEPDDFFSSSLSAQADAIRKARASKRLDNLRQFHANPDSTRHRHTDLPLVSQTEVVPPEDADDLLHHPSALSSEGPHAHLDASSLISLFHQWDLQTNQSSLSVSPQQSLPSSDELSGVGHEAFHSYMSRKQLIRRSQAKVNDQLACQKAAEYDLAALLPKLERSNSLYSRIQSFYYTIIEFQSYFSTIAPLFFSLWLDTLTFQYNFSITALPLAIQSTADILVSTLEIITPPSLLEYLQETIHVDASASPLLSMLNHLPIHRQDQMALETLLRAGNRDSRLLVLLAGYQPLLDTPLLQQYEYTDMTRSIIFDVFSQHQITADYCIDDGHGQSIQSYLTNISSCSNMFKVIPQIRLRSHFAFLQDLLVMIHHHPQEASRYGLVPLSMPIFRIYLQQIIVSTDTLGFGEIPPHLVGLFTFLFLTIRNRLDPPQTAFLPDQATFELTTSLYCELMSLLVIECFSIYTISIYRSWAYTSGSNDNLSHSTAMISCWESLYSLTQRFENAIGGALTETLRNDDPLHLFALYQQEAMVIDLEQQQTSRSKFEVDEAHQRVSERSPLHFLPVLYTFLSSVLEKALSCISQQHSHASHSLSDISTQTITDGFHTLLYTIYIVFQREQAALCTMLFSVLANHLARCENEYNHIPEVSPDTNIPIDIAFSFFAQPQFTAVYQYAIMCIGVQMKWKDIFVHVAHFDYKTQLDKIHTLIQSYSRFAQDVKHTPIRRNEVSVNPPFIQPSLGSDPYDGKLPSNMLPPVLSGLLAEGHIPSTATADLSSPILQRLGEFHFYLVRKVIFPMIQGVSRFHDRLSSIPQSTKTSSMKIVTKNIEHTLYCYLLCITSNDPDHQEHPMDASMHQSPFCSRFVSPLVDPKEQLQSFLFSTKSRLVYPSGVIEPTSIVNHSSHCPFENLFTFLQQRLPSFSSSLPPNYMASILSTFPQSLSHPEKQRTLLLYQARWRSYLLSSPFSWVLNWNELSDIAKKLDVIRDLDKLISHS